MNLENKNPEKLYILTDSETLFMLVKQIVLRLQSEDKKDNEKKYLSLSEVKSILNLKSSTSIQNLRDSGAVAFSMIGRRTIVYDKQSVYDFLEKRKKGTF